MQMADKEKILPFQRVALMTLHERAETQRRAIILTKKDTQLQIAILFSTQTPHTTLTADSRSVYFHERLKTRLYHSIAKSKGAR